MPANTQLELFETPPAPPPTCRLFLGIFPNFQATEAILNLQIESRDQFGLGGKFRPLEILHMTLHHIGDYPEVSEQIIETIGKACTIAFTGQPSLEITFDHIMSFSGKPGNLPFVLASPNGNDPLIKLHHRLITELAKVNLARLGDFKFVPHVTMLYDRKSIPVQPIAPISWKASEVVLVLSHLGETKYDLLRSWKLGE
jgi:RNA 2',3'-cyclic 3'-phosphodiesterase